MKSLGSFQQHGYPFSNFWWTFSKLPKIFFLKVDTFLAQRRMLNHDESEFECVRSLTQTHREEQHCGLTKREREKEKLLFLAFTGMAAHLKHLTGTLRECLCKNSAQQKRPEALRFTVIDRNWSCALALVNAQNWCR